MTQGPHQFFRLEVTVDESDNTIVVSPTNAQTMHDEDNLGFDLKPKSKSDFTLSRNCSPFNLGETGVGSEFNVTAIGYTETLQIELRVDMTELNLQMQPPINFYDHLDQIQGLDDGSSVEALQIHPNQSPENISAAAINLPWASQMDTTGSLKVTQTRNISWNPIRALVNNPLPLPLLIIGDLNITLSHDEAIGGVDYSFNDGQPAHDIIRDHALIDLGFKGYLFTWNNKRLAPDNIQKRDKEIPEGDWNTKYFHIKTLRHRRYNKIEWLKTSNDSWISNPNEIDDAFMFCRANLDEATKLLDALNLFCEITGQEINFEKSGIHFSPNMNSPNTANIMNLLNMRKITIGEKYLGSTIFLGQTKKNDF
ncbi:hypothetical protein IFM89_001323 [Coptis chinensis]|uniref:Uncharacterized protein n=1 Tax=Coptis chinensis TaxID=261450 RepID=A0A835L9R8_9MAGN|nr:hypothetical protein IFM89_001323 [Coptis chinensis]